MSEPQIAIRVPFQDGILEFTVRTEYRLRIDHIRAVQCYLDMVKNALRETEQAGEEKQ